MNRKHNPFVALVGLLLLALLLAITAGCAAPAAPAETEPDTRDRFDIEVYYNNCRIITDTETGVQYLLYAGPTGGVGLTVLQGVEG